VGAAALALEFAVNPSLQQQFLKRAERKGGKLTAKGEERLRGVTRELSKNVESVLEEVRTSGIPLVRQSANGAKRQATGTRKVVRRARSAAPKARVSTRKTRTTRGRRATRTTISVVKPARRAS
jgi:hypothetical protein